MTDAIPPLSAERLREIVDSARYYIGAYGYHPDPEEIIAAVEELLALRTAKGMEPVAYISSKALAALAAGGVTATVVAPARSDDFVNLLPLYASPAPAERDDKRAAREHFAFRAALDAFNAALQGDGIGNAMSDAIDAYEAALRGPTVAENVAVAPAVTSDCAAPQVDVSHIQDEGAEELVDALILNEARVPREGRAGETRRLRAAIIEHVARLTRERDEAVAALKTIVATTHNPNPTDPSRIDVAKGQHKIFEAAIRGARNVVARHVTPASTGSASK